MGMTLEEAKKELETLIIFWDGVLGIGIIKENGISTIEITIDESHDDIAQKIKDVITEKPWDCYNVCIISSKGYKFQNNQN